VLQLGNRHPRFVLRRASPCHLCSFVQGRLGEGFDYGHNAAVSKLKQRPTRRDGQRDIARLSFHGQTAQRNDAGGISGMRPIRVLDPREEEAHGTVLRGDELEVDTNFLCLWVLR
jgi:hypothetical protein